MTALDLGVGEIETPIGCLLVVTDANGVLRAADFADCEARLRRLLGPSADRLIAEIVPASLVGAIEAYLAGDLAAIVGIAVEPGGSSFQASVWTALRSLEPGRPTTYAGLAERLGRPRAARAVGAANGANPICVVLPCHRLVGAGGALTGYSGGLARKRWLLDHEARHARSTPGEIDGRWRRPAPSPP